MSRFDDPVSLLERFWLKVERQGEHLIWTGAVNGSGYGVIVDAPPSRAYLSVHYLSYTLAYGPVPDGFRPTQRESCGVRRCVRPTHLYLRPKRLPPVRRCGRGHLLSEENVEPVNGRRICRTCRAERAARTAPPVEPRPSPARPVSRGMALPTRYLTEADVLEIRRRHEAGERQSDLARHFGTSKSSVAAIISRRTWRHLPRES